MAKSKRSYDYDDDLSEDYYDRQEEKRRKLEKKKAEEKELRNRPKKRHGCRNCFLSVLVICLILDVAIIGGAFFAWNRFAQPMTGLTLPQAGKLLFGLWGAKEEEVVTNPYDPEGDLDAFYAAFKENMFIDQSVQIDLIDLAQGLLKKEEAVDANGAATGEINVYRVTGTDGYDLTREWIGTSEGKTEETPLPDNGTITGNAVLDEFLSELEFDFSQLQTYDENKAEPRLLVVSDKQFAALLNDAFTRLSGDYLANQDELVQDLVRQIAIKQVIIGNAGDKGVSIEATLALNVRQCAADVLERLYQSNPSITKFKGLVDVALKLLPQTIYVGAEVFPDSQNAEARLKLNAYDDKQIEYLSMLIDKIGGDALSSKLPDGQTLLSYVNYQVRNVMTKISAYAPVEFIETGAAVAPIQAAMDQLGVDGLSEQAFLSMVRDVKLPTAESLGVDGLLDDTVRDNAVESFLVQLCDKYAFDNRITDADGNVTGNYLTKDNLFDMLPKLASDASAIARIHPDRIDYAGEYSQEKAAQLKVNADYLALAGIMNGYLSGKQVPDDSQTQLQEETGASSILSKTEAKVLEITGNADGSALEIVIKIRLSALVKTDKAGVNRLIGQLIPDDLYLYASVNVEDPLAQATIRINDKSAEASKRHFETITLLAGKFAALPEGFGYDQICTQVRDVVNDSLKKLEDNVGVELIFGQNDVLLPNLFELVSAMPQFKEEENEMAAGEIYTVMRHAYTYTFDDVNLTEQTNAAGFVNDLCEKYYLINKIDPETQKPVLDGSDAKALFGAVNRMKDDFASYFDKDAMVADSTPDGEYDATHKPRMGEEELGFLMTGQLNLSEMLAFLDRPELIASRVDGNRIFIMVAGQFRLEGDNAKFAGILPRKAYLGVTIDIAAMNANATLWQSLSAIADDLKEDEYAKRNPIPCASFEVMGVGSNEEDFALYSKFMRAIAKQDLDQSKIAAAVDVQIVKAMSGLTGQNAPMKVTFEEGAVVLDQTVFDLAVDQIYEGEPQENRASAMQLRGVLVQTYSYRVDQSDINLSDTTNATRFVEDLCQKYYLDNTTDSVSGKPTLDGSDAKALFDAVGSMQKDFAKYFDRDAMLADSLSDADFETGDNRRPVIREEELGFLMKGQLELDRMLSFLQHPELISSQVTSTELVMRITGAIKMSESAGTYANMIPQTMYLAVRIDLTQLEANARVWKQYCIDGVLNDRYTQAILAPCVTFEVMGVGSETTDFGIYTVMMRKFANQDLDKDRIASDVDAQVVRAMSGFVGDDATIGFVFETERIVLSKTVFTLAVDAIYADGSEGQKPEPMRLRTVLKKINLPAGQDDNVSSALDTTLSEINSKYFLTQESKLSVADDGTTIQSQINAQIRQLSVHYATVIDGQKMALSTLEGNALNPAIPADELALLISEKMTIEIEGMTQPTIRSLRMIQNSSAASGRDAEQMVVAFSTSIDRTSAIGTGEYAKLLPSDEIWIIVTVDLKKLKLNELGSGTTLEPCVSFVLNDMTDGSADMNQSSGDMALFSALIRKLSPQGTAGMEIERINADASAQIRNHLQSVANGMEVSFTIDDPTRGGSLTMGSVYELACNQINASESDPTKKITADQLRNAFKALWTPLSEVVAPNRTDYAADQAIDSKIVYGDPNITDMTMSGTGNNFDAQVSLAGNVVSGFDLKASVEGEISDRNLMGTILKKEGAEQAGSRFDLAANLGLGESDLTYRWLMLARGDSSRQEVKNLFGALDGYRTFGESSAYSGGDYLIWTVNVRLTSLFTLKDAQGKPITNEDGSPKKNNTLVPDAMDVSIIMDLNALRRATDQLYSGIMFNNLHSDEHATLSYIMNRIMPEDSSGGALFGNDALAQKIQDSLMTEMVLYRMHDKDGATIREYTFGDMLDLLSEDAGGHIFFEKDALQENVSGAGAVWNNGTREPYFGFMRFGIKDVSLGKITI